MLGAIRISIENHQFLIQDSPDPLEGCDAFVDYEEGAIWIDPHLPRSLRPEVITRAIERAREELLQASWFSL